MKVAIRMYCSLYMTAMTDAYLLQPKLSRTCSICYKMHEWLNMSYHRSRSNCSDISSFLNFPCQHAPFFGNRALCNGNTCIGLSHGSGASPGNLDQEHLSYEIRWGILLLPFILLSSSPRSHIPFPSSLLLPPSILPSHLNVLL